MKACLLSEEFSENIKLNILLKHSKYGRKGNFPQWDSNPTPLICQKSALTTRPQRIPILPITYPSDLLCSHWTVTIIYKMSSAHPICACVTTAHLFHASVRMAYHHLKNFLFIEIFGPVPSNYYMTLRMSCLANKWATTESKTWSMQMVQSSLPNPWQALLFAVRGQCHCIQFWPECQLVKNQGDASWNKLIFSGTEQLLKLLTSFHLLH